MEQKKLFFFMEQAIIIAQKALLLGEVPVGAIIINAKSNEIVSSSCNMVESMFDPLAHAEMVVIKEACKKTNSKNLAGHYIFVSLEPCPMCAQAISFARIERVYFAAYDIKSGGVDNGAKIFNQTSCHFQPQIYGGIMEKNASKLLSDFFKTKR